MKLIKKLKLVNFHKKLHNLVIENSIHFCYKLSLSVVIITDPTDSSISTIAVSISSASVTCTDDEVSSLKTLETDLETMEAAIDSALTAVQAALAGAKI